MLPELVSLAQELARNRRILDEMLEQLREPEMNRAPSEAEYSPRQVLAHLAGAERGMTRLMQMMAKGEKPRLKPDYNNDNYNARQQEKRAAMSVAQLRAELGETRSDLVAFMDNLTAEDLDKRGEHPTVGDATVLQVMQTLQAHERNHIIEMSAWAGELVRARLE
jgi:hypothetical protein